jgi:glycosyltransferase involved in cell wall biosynthesis
MIRSATTPAEQTFSEQVREMCDADGPIVCFANDWRGDPTSKHHVMRGFAAHTDVLWVEAAGMRRPQLTSGHDLRRVVGKLRSAAGGLRRGEGRLQVLSPLSLPLPGSAFAEGVNRRIYRASVHTAIRRIGLRHDPLLWVYTPSVAPYLAGMRRRGLVYHCVDRWWAFSDYDADVMRRCHEQLCREADIVFASSAELLEDCREHTPHAHLIRHGVEWEHFARAAHEPHPRPADLADVRGPVLGFFGLIHEWVDQDLLCAIADAFPEATIALIGKVQVDDARLRGRANIRLLGQKPYGELPAYAAHFDVGLIPFAYNELTLAVNPIKLREYLSAGMPVVATGLPEIELLAGNPMLRTARSAEEHVAGIRHFLAAPPDAERRRRAADAMMAESWLGRCAEMAALTRAQLAAPRDPVPAPVRGDVPAFTSR